MADFARPAHCLRNLVAIACSLPPSLSPSPPSLPLSLPPLLPSLPPTLTLLSPLPPFLPPPDLIPVWSTSLGPCLETSNKISLLLLVNQVQCHLQTNGLHVGLPQSSCHVHVHVQEAIKPTLLVLFNLKLAQHAHKPLK